MKPRHLPLTLGLALLLGFLVLVGSRLQASPATPVSAPLFGMRGPCGAGGDLVHLDPQTAATKVIGSVVDPKYGWSCGVTAFNPKTNTLYTVRSTIATGEYTLMALNTLTGEAAEVGPAGQGYIYLGYNPSTDTLFGVTTIAGSENSFVHISPIDGATTPLGNIGGPQYGFSGVSALNPATNEFYIVRVTLNTTKKMLLAVNTETGEASERGDTSDGYIYLGYNSATRTLFGVKGIEGDTNNFVHLNPQTAEETVLANVGGSGYAFLGNAYALNEASNTFYVIRATYPEGEKSLLAINTGTGTAEVRGPLGAGYSALATVEPKKTYLPLIGR